MQPAEMGDLFRRVVKRQGPSGTTESQPEQTIPTSNAPETTAATTTVSNTPEPSTTNPPTTTPDETSLDLRPTSTTPSATSTTPPATSTTPPATSVTPPATSSDPPETSQTTPSETQSETPTETPTPTQTERTTASETQSASPTVTQSDTPTPTVTATQSDPVTPTATATATATASQEPTVTQTVTVAPTATASQTQIPSQTSDAVIITSVISSQVVGQSSAVATTRVITITSNRATQLPVSTQRADTTASTSFFIPVTQSNGQVTSSAPLVLTTWVVSSQSDGGVVSITQIVAQPTGQLNPDEVDRGGSAFFRNKGAVAGVFLIVGIAAAALILFLFFFCRRRRRNKQTERDAVIAAAMGPQSRVPFEDDDYDEPTNNSHSMVQRDPFAYAAGTPHAVGQHGEYLGAAKGSYEPYDPYASYPAPTASSSGHQHSTAHTRIGSVGYDGFEYDYRGYQPPTAAAGQTSPTYPRRAMSPTSGSTVAPSYAPGLGAAAGPSGQNNKRVSAAGETASIYSVPEGSLIDDDDQRLNNDMLGMRLRGGVGSEQSLRDDEDYTRKVLTVTNAT